MSGRFRWIVSILIFTILAGQSFACPCNATPPFRLISESKVIISGEITDIEKANGTSQYKYEITTRATLRGDSEKKYLVRNHPRCCGCASDYQKGQKMLFLVKDSGEIDFDECSFNPLLAPHIETALSSVIGKTKVNKSDFTKKLAELKLMVREGKARTALGHGSSFYTTGKSDLYRIFEIGKALTLSKQYDASDFALGLFSRFPFGDKESPSERLRYLGTNAFFNHETGNLAENLLEYFTRLSKMAYNHKNDPLLGELLKEKVLELSKETKGQAVRNKLDFVEYPSVEGLANIYLNLSRELAESGQMDTANEALYEAFFQIKRTDLKAKKFLLTQLTQDPIFKTLANDPNKWNMRQTLKDYLNSSSKN